MDAFEIVALIFLILGSASIIVGSALMWRANHNQNVYTGDQTSSNQYETMVFVFAAIAAWIHFFLKSYDPYGRAVWRYLYYGFFYFASVISWNNWLAMDTNRHYYNDDAGIYGESYDNSIAFGGEIIAYAGLFMCLLSIHGAFRYTSAISIILLVITIILNIVGSVILWNLDSTEIVPDDAGTVPDRFDAYYVAVSMWITIVLLIGGVFHEYRDGALAAALGIGYFGIWYLAQGFILKSVNTGSDVDRAWAGTLFCWFSAWAGLLTARFAAAVPVETPTMA